MRNLLSKTWVKVGLVFMALPASMAHATQSAGDNLANFGLERSLEASTQPDQPIPVGRGLFDALLRMLGLY